MQSMGRIWPSFAVLKLKEAKWEAIHLGFQSSLWLTGSKKTGPSSLQPQGTKCCQQSNWGRKYILSESAGKNSLWSTPMFQPFVTPNRKTSKPYLYIWPKAHKWVLCHIISLWLFMTAAIENKAKNEQGDQLMIIIVIMAKYCGNLSKKYGSSPKDDVKTAWVYFRNN